MTWLLLALLAAATWGCGESGDGGNFISGTGGTGAVTGPPAIENTILRLLFTRARIVITNSDTVTGLVVTLKDSAGAVVAVRGPFALTESIDIPLRDDVAARVAQVFIEVRTTGNQVREVISSPVTLSPQQVTTVDTGTTTPASLREIGLFQVVGGQPQAIPGGVLNMVPGQVAQLGVAAVYAAGNYTTATNISDNRIFTWTSTNTSAASVNQVGNVTAGQTPSLADITATQGSVSAVVRVIIAGGPAASPGASPAASPGASPAASPGSSPAASPGASPGASPAASPSSSPSSSPGGPTPTPTPGSGALILSQTNATTVVGGSVRITGTINGTGVNVSLTSGNVNVASASGDTLTGVNNGVTNFTATANGRTAQGNITVASGSLQNTLRLVPGTATGVSEGQQVQFQAFAQFSTGNGTVEVDVSNQCVWVVTNTTNQNLGDIISFDSGAGNFTATRGNAGTVQVGAIFSNPSAVAIGNTQVTINRSNPTITIRPVNTAEVAGARVPGGGWSRLFEAVATYPSGFSKVLRSDVTWTNTASPAIAALTTYPTGNVELVTNTTGSTGTTTLSAVYTNSQSGVAGGNHTVGVISYTLNGTQAALAPGLPGDLKVVPGRASTTNGFVRPLTVTCTFVDKNQVGNNLVMTLFTSPAATSASKAGAISLYLNIPNPYPNANATSNTLQLLTTAITPVGYTHLLRNVTTGLYNQNVLNVRVQYHPSTATLTGVGTLSNSTTGTVADIVGTNSSPGGDRDTARTGTITGMTVDGASVMTVTVTNTNLRRGQGSNATMRAAYSGVGGATEDVTQLTDWVISAGAANARIGNVTNGIGEVKGRLLIQAPPGGGTANITVGGRYPHVSPGGDSANTTVNITLP